jgi:hypothetical protein
MTAIEARFTFDRAPSVAAMQEWTVDSCYFVAARPLFSAAIRENLRNNTHRIVIRYAV